jgi:hypothetical protein
MLSLKRTKVFKNGINSLKESKLRQSNLKNTGDLLGQEDE